MKYGCGGFLLSHTLPSAVPSAFTGLASRFGMGTGRFPVAMTTAKISANLQNTPLLPGLCLLHTHAPTIGGVLCVGLVVVCIVVTSNTFLTTLKGAGLFVLC